MYPGINEPPRTLGHAARHGMTIRRYCAGCGHVEATPAAEICVAFHDWTIDALQRAGVLGCGRCRSPASLALVSLFWGRPSDVETWPADGPGWVRAHGDGVEG